MNIIAFLFRTTLAVEQHPVLPPGSSIYIALSIVQDYAPDYLPPSAPPYKAKG